jgi:hypothetical protein
VEQQGLLGTMEVAEFGSGVALHLPQLVVKLQVISFQLIFKGTLVHNLLTCCYRDSVPNAATEVDLPTTGTKIAPLVYKPNRKTRPVLVHNNSMLVRC